MNRNYTNINKGAWRDDLAFIFYLFLKVHNSDEAFLTNIKFPEKGCTKGEDLEELKKYLNFKTDNDFRRLSTIIDYSFHWASTIEGYDFWYQLHVSWLAIAEAFCGKIFNR